MLWRPEVISYTKWNQKGKLRWSQQQHLYWEHGSFVSYITDYDSSVSIVSGYSLDNQGSRVQFLVSAGNFSLHYCIQNGSGAHPASYPMGTRDSFPGDKAARAWSWPLTPSNAKVKEWVGLYLHSPNTPSWRGAQLKHRDNFTFTFTFTFI
jgi:hypothetical protein